VHTVLSFLAEQPLFFLFLLFALGSVLGSIRIVGVQIGPAAVLFAALALSSWAASQEIVLELPNVVGALGLVLFTYTVGVISGPTFFQVLRHGWGAMLTLTAILTAVAGLVAVLGRSIGLSPPTIAGTFAGSLTNTPALAAAAERSGHPGATTVGYSIAYLYGVAGMLIATTLVLRRRHAQDAEAPELTNLTIRVEREDHPSVGDLIGLHHGKVTFSRVARGESSPIRVAGDRELLDPGDLVTVVGPQEQVNAVARTLGHRSSHTLNVNGPYLDSRRITLSNRALVGRTLAETELAERFGGTISRVRRGDIDMVASDDIILQLGDRLRVIVPTGRMRDVAAYLGDSERGMSDINPIGLALGLVLGVLLGKVHVPLPGGGFEIGEAAGTLITGLIFGRLGRVGPLITGLPRTAASALSTFGMLAFLAYAGARGGQSFAEAITSSLGWKVAVIGAIATTTTAAALILVMSWLHRTEATQIAGVLGGAQTQPAVLAFANERTNYDNRVAIGYALVYPTAMVIKIVLAQLLTGT
jgi:putative transport protein